MSTNLAIKARRRMCVISGQLDELLAKHKLTENKFNRQPLEVDDIDKQWQRLEDEFYSLCECLEFVEDVCAN